MKQGVVQFAFNTTDNDYLTTAYHSCKRINSFLDLPVTVVTNQFSIDRVKIDLGVFDNVIVLEDDIKRNYIKRQLWLNKGRHKAYDLSPYDDTILVDVDYLVNSTQLLKLFEYDHDFQIHNKVKYLMTSQTHEQLGTSKFNTLWATVIRFQKTQRAKQFFDMLSVVEANYSYYSQIFHYMDYVYRNDYGSTIALKTISGQLYDSKDFIRWPLLHIPENVKVYREADTVYKLERTDIMTGRLDYIIVKDLDFHLMDKKNFLELFDE